MFQIPTKQLCKLRRNMYKLISILIVKESNIQEDTLEAGIKYVISQLTDLRYNVKKVTVLESDAQAISFELEHSLKQNDFVILIDKWNSQVTFTSACNVFNTDLVVAHSIQHKTSLGDLMIPKISKFLEYDNSIKLSPVLYMGRLFIVRESNVKPTFDHILKPYLKKFNKPVHFMKRLCFKGCEIDVSESRRKCGCLSFNFEKDGDLSIVELSSAHLLSVVENQRKLEVKYGPFLLNDSGKYFSESIYDRNYFERIQKAVECVEQTLHQYGPSNVFISFNGGKDCTVLLHLVLGVLRERFPEYAGRLVCMYIRSLNPFPEVNSFIENLRDYYNIEIVTIAKGVKEGLEMFLYNRPHMKACLMGTRRTDPYSEHLHICQMTDPSWPQVMRVSPLLDWHYSDIWDYLLYFQVPYCSLYDDGYTSLGSINNTIKNPKLLYTPSIGQEVYLPAYKLLDGSSERDGRV